MKPPSPPLPHGQEALLDAAAHLAQSGRTAATRRLQEAARWLLGGGTSVARRLQAVARRLQVVALRLLGGGTAVARWRSTWYSSRDQNSRGSAPPGARYTCNGMQRYVTVGNGR